MGSQIKHWPIPISWCIALILTIAAPCFSQEDRPPVVVSSKNFPESRLLGEIMAQLIERKTDIPVKRKLNLGFSTIVFQSLRNGEIDLYPEYTGTAWEEYLKRGEKVSDPLKAYLIVSEEMEDKLDIRWLMPFGFANSFALAMTKQKAKELGITRISDLRKHQDQLKVGVSNDFYQRNDGFQPLVKAYGLKFPSVRQMEHGLIYEAIDSGEVDIVDIWTTDGKLLRHDLQILEDDKGFFPPYDCAPVIRAETLEMYPELEDVLNTLAFRIDNKKMQELNERVDNARNEQNPYRKVASEYLNEMRESKPTQREEQSIGWLAVLRKRAPEHLLLTGVAVILAILIAVPLGIYLTRHERVAPIILGGAGVIQTIPSLALVALLIPLFGLGTGTAIVGLFLYALLPIIRNTYTGIKEVDEHLIEAARGIGMTRSQILAKVELPLATRTIMAGVRTASVISVGVATLAAFIGAGGLGQPILTGLQLNSTRWILWGAIPAALLALLVDYGLGWVEHLVRPRGVGEG